jgi:two-component system phosphate regulon sensor histidine kinase PhoR
MKRHHSIFYHITIFVLAQIAWLSLLGIWIYWYISNYIIFATVGNILSAQIISEGRNVFVLVSGLVLLIVVSVLMSIQFYRLNLQFKLTRLYDNFIANVTHELKSPLASIQLTLETMDLHDLRKEKQMLFISMMLKDIDRLNSLINVILQIPALEQKKIAYQYELFSMEPLLRELIQESRDRFGLPENSVLIHGKTDCQCVVDRNALRIVLDNLMDNSIKYSTGPAKITCTIRRTATHLIFSFSDLGIGIAVPDQKKLFEKFFRIHDDSSPNVKGTGLGLYLSREIVRLHGGKMIVESKGLKKGTTFRIELPAYGHKNRQLQNLLKIVRRRKNQEELTDA